MDEGYDDDEGGRRWGGKRGGRASGRANMVAAAPIVNEVLVSNLGKIADKRRTAPVVVAPLASSSGEGRDGGVFVLVFVASTSSYHRAAALGMTRCATTSLKRPQVHCHCCRPCERSCCL